MCLGCQWRHRVNSILTEQSQTWFVQQLTTCKIIPCAHAHTDSRTTGVVWVRTRTQTTIATQWVIVTHHVLAGWFVNICSNHVTTGGFTCILFLEHEESWSTNFPEIHFSGYINPHILINKHSLNLVFILITLIRLFVLVYQFITTGHEGVFTKILFKSGFFFIQSFFDAS